MGPRPQTGALAALAAAFALAAGPASDEPTPLTAGASFRTLSRITYAPPPGAEAGAEPSARHTLEAYFVGAERARLLLRAVEGNASNRVVNYRLGDDVYVLPPAPDAATSAGAEPRSRQLAGELRLELVRSLELRRALFAWPADLAWSGDGDARRAPLGDAGALVASLRDDGLPTRVAALDAEGDEVEALADVVWRAEGGRHWPHRLRLTYRGRDVWTEEVHETRAGVRLVDLFFLPRDRREERAPFREASAGLEHTDRIESWRASLPLRAPGEGWSAAWGEARDAADRAHAALRGAGLDRPPIPSLVLGHDGLPAAVRLDLVTLERPPAEPADGVPWERAPGGPAVRLGATGLAAAAGELGRALAALPEGARIAEAVVRRLPGKDLALLVLILEQAD